MGGKSVQLSPSTNNYTRGGGILYIALWIGSAPGAYSDVGNCPSLSLEPTEQSLEHFSSRQAQLEQDDERVVLTGYTGNFVLDEVSVENLRMFLRASLSGTKVLYMNGNVSQLYALKFVSDNDGPNYKWEMWKCKLTPNGAFSLINQEFTTLSFNIKGMTDRVNHNVSPWATITFDTTTTTSSTTTTTA